MKCLGKEDQVEWWASSLRYKRSSLPKEGHMERLSLQSNWLSRCHSQLAYRDGCCGPQEATVRGVNATAGPAPRGRLAFHLLTPACLFCTGRLRGALHWHWESEDLHQGNRLTQRERQIEWERETEEERERETNSSSSLWSDKKMTAFLWSLLFPPWAEKLTCRQAACQTQLTRLPPERCRKLDSLLLVGKRPPQQVSVCTVSVKEVPLISYQPALQR